MVIYDTPKQATKKCHEKHPPSQLWPLVPVEIDKKKEKGKRKTIIS